PDDVTPALDHGLPPLVLHVAQHQDADRSVVVGGADASVDLRRLEHEAAAFGEIGDGLERNSHGWNGEVEGPAPPSPSGDPPIPTLRGPVGGYHGGSTEMPSGGGRPRTCRPVRSWPCEKRQPRHTTPPTARPERPPARGPFG